MKPKVLHHTDGPYVPKKDYDRLMREYKKLVHRQQKVSKKKSY